ncbi:TaqI-like C-terminal specificity domain-containing protein [Myroides odoratus]
MFWYRYIYPKNLTLFDNEKLVAPEISLGGNFSYDQKGQFYSTTTIYGYIKKDDVSNSYKSLMAILNSKLLWWYLVNTGTVLANGYFRFKPSYLNSFPMPNISFEKDCILEKLVNQILDLKRNNSELLVKNLETQIDEIVFDMYQLTEEEKNIINNI